MQQQQPALYTQTTPNQQASSQYPRSMQQSSMGQQLHQQGSSVYHAGSVSGASRLITGGAMSTTTTAGPERIQSTRKISSTIVNEQLMGPPPQDYPVREVEVPGPTEEVIKVVPRKVVQEIEKRVPKYVYEYIDKIVEVPRVEYVERIVEKPVYTDVPVPKKVIQYVDVPKEVIVEKKVPKINYVEKRVEVPGPVVQVPKPYDVEQVIEYTQYTDHKKPVVVAQAVRPMIVEGAGFTEVDVYEYEPECVAVDVHVVKGVQAQIQAGGVVESQHRVVSVPSAQYNTILKQMNAHLSATELQKLPYYQDKGSVTFLGEAVHTTEVARGTFVSGLDMNNMTKTWVDQSSRKVYPVNDMGPPPQLQSGTSSYYQQNNATRITSTSAAAYGINQQADLQQQQYLNAAATPLQMPANSPRAYNEQQSRYGNIVTAQERQQQQIAAQNNNYAQMQTPVVSASSAAQPTYANSHYPINPVINYAPQNHQYSAVDNQQAGQNYMTYQ